MKRIYHPYWNWEDAQAGLYDLEKNYTEQEEELLCNNAVKLLTTSWYFYIVGLKIILNWPNACEHNLTNTALNRQAWLGQAACCYEFKIPERITKLAWRLLTIDQQIEANKIADNLILYWEGEHAKKISE